MVYGRYFHTISKNCKSIDIMSDNNIFVIIILFLFGNSYILQIYKIDENDSFAHP
jgi:hypothetical protein